MLHIIVGVLCVLLVLISNLYAYSVGQSDAFDTCNDALKKYKRDGNYLAITDDGDLVMVVGDHEVFEKEDE